MSSAGELLFDRTRIERHVMSCFVIMVAMNEAGEKVAIAPFTPLDDADHARWQAAERRRALRSAPGS